VNEVFEKLLTERRLDGAETVFGIKRLDSGEEEQKYIEKTRQIASNLVKKTKTLSSGGVDAHNLQDFSNFASSEDYARKTSGMAENIIAKSNVDKKWSNI